MNKLSILLLGLAMTLVAGVATDCLNPMIAALSYTALAAPATPAGGAASLSFCKTSLATTVCCADADINGIQTKTTAIKTTLTTLVSTRDAQILAARAALAAKAKDLTLAAFVTAATAAASALTTMATADATSVATSATLYSGYITSFITGYAALNTGFTTYQTTRATCFAEILKTQAGVYCFACDPEYLAQGVDDSTGAITFSTTVETRLRDACFPYLDAADDQNLILKLNSQIANLDAMTAALVTIAGTDATAATAAVTTYLGKVATSTATIAELPASCTSTSCPWISADLRTAYLADTTALNLGGAAVTLRRLLEQDRSLTTTGTMNYAEDAAGVTITFDANPGAVVNVYDDLSSVIRNGVISCIAAVFVTLLV